MNNIAFLVGLLALGLFFVGLSTVLIPWGFVKRRSHGVGVVAASLVLLVIGASLSPTTQPSEASPKQSVSVPRVHASAGPTPEQSRDFSSARNLLLSNQKNCMAALRRAAATHGRYNSFVASKGAEADCRSSANAILEMAKGESRSANPPAEFRDAFQCFGFAEGQKANAMGSAAQINNSAEVKPSEVAAFRSDLRDALQRDRECGSVLAAAEVKFGYTAEPLKEVIGHIR